MKNTIAHILTIVFLVAAAPYAKAEPPTDCQEAPKDALLEIPEFLGEWVGIYCSPYGHALVPKFGHLWIAKNGKPFFLYANMQLPAPKAGKHSSYFTKKHFGLIQLYGEELEKAVKTLELETKSQGKYEDIIQMELLSNDGTLFAIYFYMNKSGPEWVLFCADRCRRAVIVKSGPLDTFKTK